MTEEEKMIWGSGKRMNLEQQYRTSHMNIIRIDNRETLSSNRNTLNYSLLDIYNNLMIANNILESHPDLNSDNRISEAKNILDSCICDLGKYTYKQER